MQLLNEIVFLISLSDSSLLMFRNTTGFYILICILQLHEIQWWVLVVILVTSLGFSMEKAREFQKNIYLCFIDYAKAFDCVDLNKLGKILKKMEIPDHLTCLLRNLYTGQEATIRAGHGTTDWFQIGKGVRQGYIVTLLI